MKLSNSFDCPLVSVLLFRLAFIFYGSCFTCFSFALKHWQLSVAYAMYSARILKSQCPRHL